MIDDLFLKIIRREIKAEIVHETDEVLAFRDITPQAPVHILVVPKLHIRTLNDLNSQHTELVGKLLLAATEVARNEGISEDGYRLVMNCGADGGQSVGHIHVHVLGGRVLGWPPG